MLLGRVPWAPLPVLQHHCELLLHPFFMAGVKRKVTQSAGWFASHHCLPLHGPGAARKTRLSLTSDRRRSASSACSARSRPPQPGSASRHSRVRTSRAWPVSGKAEGNQTAGTHLPPPPKERGTTRKESQLHPCGSTHHVSLLVVLIPNDEDHVKSGQDGGHKINVLLALGLIPAPKD